MPVFIQESVTRPEVVISDIVVGKDYRTQDAQVDENLTLTARSLLVLDGATGYWRAFNDGVDALDTFDKDGCGFLLEDVTTGAGERPRVPVLVEGEVNRAKVTNLPATGKPVGSRIGLIWLR